MNRTSFINHVSVRTLARLELLRQKGQAYSGDADAFANFKRNAEKLGLTRYQIWAVYCGKHLDAIFGAIRKNPNFPVDPSEGMQGRIDDSINYLELLSGLVKETTLGEMSNKSGSVPSNEEVAKHLMTLAMGVGISNTQSVAMIKEYLDTFYGPRHFSL